VSKSTSKSANQSQAVAEFVPLLNGAEKAAAVRKREQLFTEGWDEVHDRVQVWKATSVSEEANPNHDSEPSKGVQLCDFGAGQELCR